MLRFLKFLGVFLLTAAVIFSIIYIPNRDSFKTFFENRQSMAEGSEWIEKTYSLAGLTQFVDENPQLVSVASIVNEYPDSTLYFMENERRALGTLTNLLLLIAASDLIEQGEIDPDEMLNREDITRYQLPEVYENVHNETFITAVNRGWVENHQLKTGHALELLAEFNDLALADYIWWMIGKEYWSEFQNRFDLVESDIPLPFSGLYLAIAPQIQGMDQQQIIEQNRNDRSAFNDFVISHSVRFTNDASYRDSVTTLLNQNRLGNTFMEERDALELFPKSTARELTGLLLKLAKNELISPEADNRVLDWMRWPMRHQRGITRNFSDYGAIFDNRMGLLNGVDFGTSVFTGDTTVQAVFFDQLPVAFWLHMSSNHMHQDFQQRLIFDPAMIERMTRVAERHAGQAVNYTD